MSLGLVLIKAVNICVVKIAFLVYGILENVLFFEIFDFQKCGFQKIGHKSVNELSTCFLHTHQIVDNA